MTAKLNVILLHDQMLDKQGDLVTTSLTMIDLHDIARSCCTYGVETFFIAHPSNSLKKLARTLKKHWEVGYGSTYNPNRKEALDKTQIITDLDEAIQIIDSRSGQLPKLLATSAHQGEDRLKFAELTKELNQDNNQQEYLLMLGTGWGMSKSLLDRADYFLEPINGPTEYNHLSVRSACAIMLDRILA